MSQQSIMLRSHAVMVEPFGGSAVVKVDASGGTVYYADNRQVSSASNQGSIAPGGSATFTTNTWVTASGVTTPILVTTTSVYDEWASVNPLTIDPGTGSAITVQGASGTNLGASQTIDFQSREQEIWLTGTINANLTVTLANRVAGCKATLLLTQDGTGSRTLSVTDGTTPQTVAVNPAATSLSVVEVACPDATALNALSPVTVLTSQQVLLQNEADLTRDWLLVSGHIAQSIDRRQAISNVTLSTGVMFHIAVPAPAGRAINNVTVYSTNVGATTPTNQWGALYDANRNLLQTGVDQTTTAWGTNTQRVFALAAPYTPGTDALVYASVMVAAATPPNLAGLSAASNPISQAPSLCFSSTATGLTTPATAPASVTIASSKAPFWASLS